MVPGFARKVGAGTGAAYASVDVDVIQVMRGPTHGRVGRPVRRRGAFRLPILSDAGEPEAWHLVARELLRRDAAGLAGALGDGAPR